MSILDPRDLPKADPQSMYALLESFPDHVRAAARAVKQLSLSLPRPPAALIITGLGGSAIGGDLVRSVAGTQLAIPLIINRDYDLPAYTNASTLVIACSYSGNTEETLSAYDQARQAGAMVVCITSGGQLEAQAKKDSVPVVALPGGLPPRAALGYALITLLGVLQALRIIPDMGEAIEESAALLETLRSKYRVETPAAANPAKHIAESLQGRFVAIYGSCGIMESAAYRWRSQIAENAKNLAMHHVLPEMNHNELVGWQCPQEMLRKVGVIFLRDQGDHPQVQRRFDLTREVISRKTDVIHEVWSVGNSILARVLSTVYLGDYVSLYLAYLNGVDPTPVEVISAFKSKLQAAH